MQTSDGGKCSTSRPGGFISGQRTRSTHKMGSCTETRISLVVLVSRKRKLLPYGIEAGSVGRPSRLIVTLLNISWENRGVVTP